MTDKYGDQDNMQQEDELQDFGNQAETWQEDQPPVDDFSDSDVSVDGDDDADESVGVRKGSMLVPLVAGIIGVLFIGFVTYLQFGSKITGGTSAPASAALLSDSSNFSSKDEGAAPSSSTTDSSYSAASAAYPPSTHENSMSGIGNALQLPEDEKGISTEPMTAAVSSMGENQLPPVIQGAQAETSSPAVVASQPVVNAESAAPLASQPIPVETAAVVKDQSAEQKAAEPEKTEKVGKEKQPIPLLAVTDEKKPAPVAEAVAPKQGGASVALGDAKIAELAARMDALQKMLEQTVQQMNRMSNTVANIQAASAQAIVVSGADKKTETKPEDAASGVVGEVSSVEPGKVTAPDNKEDGISAKQAIEDKEAVAKADDQGAVVKQVADKHKSNKSGSVKAKKKTAKKSSVETTKWTLRAATVNTAWVSKGSDSTELRQVEVGQTLPGIGTIKAIKQVGDGWEVVGTKGKVQ